MNFPPEDRNEPYLGPVPPAPQSPAHPAGEAQDEAPPFSTSSASASADAQEQVDPTPADEALELAHAHLPEVIPMPEVGRAAGPRREAIDSPGARLGAQLVGKLIVGIASAITGMRAFWSGNMPAAEPTLYFANHTSHADFVLLWAALPSDLRSNTRPVAGADYWLTSKIKRFIGIDVFNALLIERDRSQRSGDPVGEAVAALHAGDSLIIFPEGTRNMGEEELLPLKSGIFHIARQCPHVRLVPVWIENLKRVLPKGAVVPVPLACAVRFGPRLEWIDGEEKDDFMARARAAMLAMRPPHDQEDGETPPNAMPETGHHPDKPSTHTDHPDHPGHPEHPDHPEAQ
ncbi:hypothetical protein NBRC116584_29370 [Hydrogenophaga sp. 5NK40-0174]